MKKQIHIPPPAHATPARLAPAGKHSLGLRKPGRHAKIRERAAAKARFLSESSQEANRIANERALRQAYAEFYSTPEGRAFARAEVKANANRKKADKNIDFADPAELPDSLGCGSHNGRKLVNNGEHPVDVLEPRKLSVQVEGLSDEEISLTSETFGACLRWALDDPDLVQRGMRAIVIVFAMRRDIGAGMQCDCDLWNEFVFDPACRPDVLKRVGAVFGRFLEFISRGPVKSSIGERLDMTAYMLRPDLLPQNTLAKMGEIVNKTRQAKGKLSNDFRDTFGGMKAPAQRPEITRDRCTEAQLQPANA